MTMRALPKSNWARSGQGGRRGWQPPNLMNPTPGALTGGRARAIMIQVLKAAALISVEVNKVGAEIGRRV